MVQNSIVKWSTSHVFDSYRWVKRLLLYYRGARGFSLVLVLDAPSSGMQLPRLPTWHPTLCMDPAFCIWFTWFTSWGIWNLLGIVVKLACMARAVHDCGRGTRTPASADGVQIHNHMSGVSSNEMQQGHACMHPVVGFGVEQIC